MLARRIRRLKDWAKHALLQRLQRSAGIDALIDRVEGLEARLGETADSLRGRADKAEAHLGEQQGRLEASEAALTRLDSIFTVSAWIEQAALSTSPLISVVVATRNRARFLERSIPSVIAQTYPNWELIVVDDGGDDASAELIASFADPRLRYQRIEHAGASAARNTGLDEASGELIAYLDDDNAMHPGWLKAIAWAFEQRPERNVLYGGFVIDDTARLKGGDGGALPSLWLNPFDPETIDVQNVGDTSAIAHRAGLEGARWDESLLTAADWDLLARLSSEHPPLLLPVIACFYFTDAPRRLSGHPTEGADAKRVTEKARRAWGRA